MMNSVGFYSSWCHHCNSFIMCRYILYIILSLIRNIRDTLGAVTAPNGPGRNGLHASVINTLFAWFQTFWSYNTLWSFTET